MVIGVIGVVGVLGVPAVHGVWERDFEEELARGLRQGWRAVTGFEKVGGDFEGMRKEWDFEKVEVLLKRECG